MICSYCSGSGTGLIGMRCTRCGGSGQAPSGTVDDFVLARREIATGKVLPPFAGNTKPPKYESGICGCLKDDPAHDDDDDHTYEPYNPPPMADRLRALSKGFQGGTRTLLENAANVVEGRQQETGPSAHCASHTTYVEECGACRIRAVHDAVEKGAAILKKTAARLR